MQSELQNRIIFFFGHNPTVEQSNLIEQLDVFSLLAINERNCLLLKGYAGTGKTAITGAYVKALRSIKREVVLLAPTGRAAKVLSQNADFRAFTIHKFIYRKKVQAGGGISLVIAPNLRKNCIFLVDEASMIGDYSVLNDGTVSSRNLLDDLLEFVYQDASNKLIFIGDEGQLPPVGSDFSPALNLEYMQQNFFGIAFREFKLTEVHRQATESLILENATLFRKPFEEFNFPLLHTDKMKDVCRIDGLDLQEQLENAYNFYGMEEVIFVTKSNKKAMYYNMQIRNRILWLEDDLCKNDSLMVVKNNYFWLEEQSPMGFIANGEIMKIIRVGKREEMYGHKFVWATVLFVDYEEIGEVEVLLLLDILHNEQPALTRNQQKELFFAIEQDYMDERNKQKRYEKIMKTPYFNALQVKFSYAVTCHKSQGGQWEAVFVDHGYIQDEFFEDTLNRWLYTAITRAKEKLFLVGFDKRFYGEEE